MRLLCRPNSLWRYFLPVLFLCGLTPVGVSSQTRPPIRAGESLDSSGVPPEWQNPLRDLSSEIAKLLSGNSKIALVVNNISSLAAEDIPPIETALKAQLRAAGVRLGTEDSGSTSVLFTLSEGIEGYVAVAQIKSNGNEQVAIVILPRVAMTASQTDGVQLNAKLVWQQPTQILDFVLPASPGFSQNILSVLEPQRLMFYSRDIATHWQLVRAIPSGSSVATRDWHGHIELSQSSSSGDARWPGSECAGDFLRPASVACSASDHRGDTWISGDSRSPFAPASGGEAISVALQCRVHPIALATGGGDWTQPDFIQAYELRNTGDDAAVPSGNPLNFDGPVMAIWPANEAGTARAVVWNLETGNYEAYVVTATCNQ